jgi:hypothetical protein
MVMGPEGAGNQKKIILTKASNKLLLCSEQTLISSLNSINQLVSGIEAKFFQRGRKCIFKCY